MPFFFNARIPIGSTAVTDLCPAPHHPWPVRPPLARPPSPQFFFMCGLLALVFDVFAVPFFTARLGIATSQRAASAIEVLVYLAYQLLPCLHGTERPLTAVSVLLLSVTWISSNVVCFYIISYCWTRALWSVNMWSSFGLCTFFILERFCFRGLVGSVLLLGLYRDAHSATWLIGQVTKGRYPT